MAGNGSGAAKKSGSKAPLVILIIVTVLLIAALAGAYVLLMNNQNEQNRLGILSKNAEDAQKTANINEYNQLMVDYVNETARIDAENAELTRRIKPAPAASGWDMIDVSTFPIENAVKVNASRMQLQLGGGVLVNYWHAVPGDMPTDQLVSIQGTLENRWQVGKKGSAIKMYPVAVFAYDKMMTAAKEDGLESYIASEAWRSNEEQQETWDKYEGKKEYSSLAGEAKRAKINETVSYPGTSEYQSGFAVCIQRYKAGEAEFNKTFAGTEHSKWLQENSWKYGFIFRYPISGYPESDTVDKSWKTGRANQLSIYRYVGEANAAVMHINDWCMEEYYEYLAEHPHIEIYENGVKKYEIARVAYDGGDEVTFSVGSCLSYEVSIDNLGGIIIGMCY